MKNYKRRDFIKHSGIGIGALMASQVLHLNLFANKNKSVDTFNWLFGFTKEELNKILVTALSKGGSYADLYFEYRKSASVTMSEDIIKSSTENISLGVGIRVLNGQQTGFSYTNDISLEKIKETALTAASIANSVSKIKVANLKDIKLQNNFYNIEQTISSLDLTKKIELIKNAYNAAKNYDSKIIKVSSSISDEVQYITIVTSDGMIFHDFRPQVRLNVSATAENPTTKVKNTGLGNDGGRVGLDFYLKTSTPESIGKKAAEEALILLEAKNAPPGELPIVLSKHQSGVMIHEAVGHPLEADGIWKKTSIMHDKLGQMVANPIVTIYDDATIPNYRGSLNVDDEGIETKNVMLIEKGKLVGFLNDKLSANIMNTSPNGHGRRESYEFPPIPRMNNTILEKGSHDPQEIIQSVEKGFYAQSYQGGMVDGTGKFTFSVNLGYMIEKGKLTYPLKNATLIGRNIEILNNVDMIANDTGFFLGTCGKDGQSVPVTCGTPTLRIKKMTVGGIV